MRRRRFLRVCGHAGAASLVAAGWPRSRPLHAAETTQTNAGGFFTLGKRKDRWFFLTPDRQPFFSLGLNHIDPASLRYADNIHLWRERYDGSMLKWIRESVRPRLADWGFNSVGWTQEVITRRETNHRHSRHWTAEEYDALDMPYCHQLPFADFHQWEAETRHPDFFSDGFADWADHVAREHCVPLADDPRLIGYFYIDCPTWVHVRPINEWKGPIFDPNDLKTAAGRAELTRIATQWYRVTHDAIRRYDPHHLILGDRYEANAPLPIEVVNAAEPFVDVLSFQDFRDPAGHLAAWHERTGMPVLWADGSKQIPVEEDGETWGRNNGRWYREVLAGLRKNPGCVGAHLCGAFQRNRVRRRGLLDLLERPDTEMIDEFRAANEETDRWVRTF